MDMSKPETTSRRRLRSFCGPQCQSCGKFMRVEPGCAWRMIYSGAPMPSPDREIFRCLKCTKEVGPFTPQLGIKPEYSCGVIQP